MRELGHRTDGLPFQRKRPRESPADHTELPANTFIASAPGSRTEPRPGVTAAACFETGALVVTRPTSLQVTEVWKRAWGRGLPSGVTPQA
jgi:hypothetical protein